ncbi:small ubiquitin-related modifier [Lentinula lateritia]|uniref:Small ubiquitin-related modifier n=1 Tax=Lentinula aff. lateritia TaxID=2804960 RepID=A0ACC1TPK5_9AGAR|nr:small ubiquitin-related modifier [Lentinula aff. lateritia]KAJ3847297.1 small ubiquitin-related modifier [Lentinula lateritia]
MSEEDQQAPPTQEDVKTGDNAPINVKVVSSSGEEVFFKIKRVTPLRKLLGAYATKVGKEPHTIRFLYDGARINDSDTPESLEMEDNDTIDVMVEQVGGYLS